MKEAEWKQKEYINYTPALQSPPIPRPPPKDASRPKTSVTATALSQLVLCRRRYRLPDLVPSFHHFKLRQGAKWTMRTDDLLLR
jgi:hypothetical protein